jgi:5-formyltetrahydrofolate cyclo-ligase
MGVIRTARQTGPEKRPFAGERRFVRDVDVHKERLRRRLRRCLLTITDEHRSRMSEHACRNLSSTVQFQRASAVMLYLSMHYEIDTSGIIRLAWELGKTVAVPRVCPEDGSMVPVRIDSLERDLAVDVIGVRNPVGGAPVPLGQIDLVVAPALAFDKEGNRLGRGGSYYDKFFADPQLAAARCGLAYHEQVVEAVPVTDRDEPVDLVVTNKQIIYCNDRRAH